MIKTMGFYYVEKTGKRLEVVLSDFASLNDRVRASALPLIWNNNGLYGIICKEKIENMFDGLCDRKNMPALNRNSSTSMFYWDEVEIIDQKIGKLLTGEVK